MRKIITLLLLTSIYVAATAQEGDFATDPALLIFGKESNVRISATDGNLNGARKVWIRGVNAIHSDSQPLWIIDGTRITSSLQNSPAAFWQYDGQGYMPEISIMQGFDVHDIKSIEVLKNISSTAEYGSSGANGVIIITTDRSSTEDFIKANIDLSYIPGGTRHIPSHSYSLRLRKNIGNTVFSTSISFRDTYGQYREYGNRTAGARISVENRHSELFRFGVTASLSYNAGSSLSGCQEFGSETAMLAFRDIFPNKSWGTGFDDWLADYDDNSIIFRTTDSFFLDIILLKQLKWKNSVGLDFVSSSRDFWYGNSTDFGRTHNGAAALSYASVFSSNIKTGLEYSSYLRQNHHIKANAFFEAYGNISRYNTMCGNDFFAHELRADALESLGSKVRIRTNTNKATKYGVYASAEYDYKKSCGISALWRIDNYAAFDDDRCISYPSIEAYADIGRMTFKRSDIISSLKISGGWGKAGRENEFPATLLHRYASTSWVPTDDTIVEFYKCFHRINSQEAHLTLSSDLFNDRLGLEVSLYSKRTGDVLSLYCYGEPIDGDSGLWRKTDRTLKETAFSEICNRGVEIDIDGRLIQSRQWRLQISANVALNRNRLTETDNSISSPILNNSGFSPKRNIKGNSLGCFYGNVISADGRIESVGILGNAIPEICGGLTINAGFRKINIGIMFDGTYGNKILNLNNMIRDGRKVVARSDYVEDGSFLRLARLNASYDIPLKNRNTLKALSIRFCARNIFTVSAYSGLNPDVNCYSWSSSLMGIDYGSYPVAAMLTIGVSAKF